MATLIHLQVAAFVLENAHLDRMGCTELAQEQLLFFFHSCNIVLLKCNQ